VGAPAVGAPARLTKVPAPPSSGHAPLAPHLPRRACLCRLLSLALAVAGGVLLSLDSHPRACACLWLSMLVDTPCYLLYMSNLPAAKTYPKKARRASLCFLRKYEVSPLRLIPPPRVPVPWFSVRAMRTSEASFALFFVQLKRFAHLGQVRPLRLCCVANRVRQPAGNAVESVSAPPC
jgi:hypothetical protein